MLAGKRPKLIKAVPGGKSNRYLSNESGGLKHGNQELMLSFTDASGSP